MGRRSLLTPERAALIIQLIQEGNTIKDAAQAAGVTPRTIQEWRARGEDDLTKTLDPTEYTLPQLKALAEAQEVELPTGRLTKKRVAALLHPDTPYSHFARALTRARSQGITHAIREMRRAGKDDWRMWAHYLAHQHPEVWARSALDQAAHRAEPDAGPDAAALLEQGKAQLEVLDGGRR